jgi:hypothetical protein
VKLKLNQIYNGLPVKTTNDEGTWEIIRIDEFSETIWCSKLNSIDLELKEFRIEELKR